MFHLNVKCQSNQVELKHSAEKISNFEFESEIFIDTG